MFNDIGMGLMVIALLCVMVGFIGIVLNPPFGLAVFVAAIVNGALSCAALGE